MLAHLKQRDFELLLDLYENQFLIFDQIKRRHFKGKAKSTLHNRLKKLRELKVIKRRRFYLELRHLESKKCVSSLYELSSRGLLKLQAHFPQKTFRPLKKINLSRLYHDCLLVDLLERLKQKSHLGELSNTNSPDFLNNSQTQIPDAILECAKTNSKIAIELELTAKSYMRYRQILMNYLLSSEFKEVHYFCQSQQIRKKILKVLNAIGGSHHSNAAHKRFQLFDLNKWMKDQKASQPCPDLEEEKLCA